MGVFDKFLVIDIFGILVNWSTIEVDNGSGLLVGAITGFG